MPSTPKHLAMYEAFGWTPPKFAHVGLLLDKSRAKLSKRNQDIDISSFRNQGIFPETLTNFIALLGWSHTQPKDLMGMDDLIKNVRHVLALRCSEIQQLIFYIGKHEVYTRRHRSFF